MISINGAKEKVSLMEKEVNPILTELGVNTESSIWEDVLGLHEAATKLFVAVMRKDNGKCGQEELNRRVASALIGVMILANKLNVTDLEEEYVKRIQEVIDGNKEALKNK